MAYSVTAYLPGPRSTYADYDVHHRQDPEAAFHLDDCLRRAGRQHTKLDSLERTCEDNLDTCNMYYKNAHKREIELGDSLRDARVLLASLPSSSGSKYEYKTRLGRASSSSRSYGSYNTSRKY